MGKLIAANSARAEVEPKCSCGQQDGMTPDTANAMILSNGVYEVLA